MDRKLHDELDQTQFMLGMAKLNKAVDSLKSYDMGETNDIALAFSRVANALAGLAEYLAPAVNAAYAALRQAEEVMQVQRLLEAYGVKTDEYSAEDLAKYFGPMLASGNYIMMTPAHAEAMDRWARVQQGSAPTLEELLKTGGQEVQAMMESDPVQAEIFGRWFGEEDTNDED